jgi:hypothetical protein
LASASTLLTVTANVILTSLIAFHLIRARRRLSKLLPSGDRHFYTGILAILVESALPLTLFGVITAVMQQTSRIRSSQTAGFYVCDTLFTGLFYSFCVGLDFQVSYQHYINQLFSLLVALTAHDHFPSYDWPLIHQVSNSQRRSPISALAVCPTNSGIISLSVCFELRAWEKP